MKSEKLRLLWHPDNVGVLDDYPKNTTKRFLWRCQDFPDLDLWEMSVVHMRARKGCPFCSGRRVNKRNCLKSVNPKAALMWDSKLNLLSPNEVTAKSSKRVWWKCKSNHSWEATVCQVSRGHGCPFCCNQKIDESNCFAVSHADIAKDLLNKEDGYRLSYGSQKKVWWLCNIHGKYEMSVANRTTQGSGCQRCAIDDRANKRRVGALEKAYAAFDRSCKRYGRENELSFDLWEELVLGNCSYCGDGPSRKIKGYSTMVNGIDRVANSLGYLVNNVVTCCWKCNKMKGTMSRKDFLQQVDKVSRCTK